MNISEKAEQMTREICEKNTLMGWLLMLRMDSIEFPIPNDYIKVIEEFNTTNRWEILKLLQSQWPDTDFTEEIEKRIINF